MYTNQGIDAPLLEWRVTNTNHSQTIHSNPYLPTHVIQVAATVTRNTKLNALQTAATVDMRVETQPLISYPIGERVYSTDVGVEHDFDYNLKVLYEYGNNQYQFSDDGSPTKVLPNFVPVGPSPSIPQI